MRIEHVAFNVDDPVGMARWYVEHLGFLVARGSSEPPYAHFLMDSTRTCLIEIYANRSAPIPDYRAQHPGTLHLAFVSSDVDADAARLTAAGAKLDGEVSRMPSGDVVCFLRDPWGFVLQLVKRAQPMLQAGGVAN